MKITIEVDCTPEEARRAMGLPDFTPVHEKYVASLTELMDKGTSPEMMESLLRAWAPIGDAGLTAWRSLFDMAGRKS